MNWYNEIYSWYNSVPKKWDIERVWNVVNKKITPDEYYKITGIIYPNKG